MTETLPMDIRIDEMVDRFKVIGEESMKDLPVYKDGLEVEPVAFVPWAEGYLGMLITPWFLNLIYLPHDRRLHADKELGDKVIMALPSGEHGLRVGEDDVVGRYLFISLASPMFKYDNQEMARLAAFSHRATYLDPPRDGENASVAAPDPSEVLSGNAREIAGNLMDNKEDIQAALAAEAEAKDAPKSVDRRDLLRGSSGSSDASANA